MNSLLVSQHKRAEFFAEFTQSCGVLWFLLAQDQ